MYDSVEGTDWVPSATVQLVKGIAKGNFRPPPTRLGLAVPLSISQV